jgi:tight adherence protein B
MSPILYVLVFLTAILGFEGAVSLWRDRSKTKKAAQQRLARMAQTLQAKNIDPENEKEESILRGRESDEDLFDRILLSLPGARSVSLTLYRAGLPMTLRRLATISLALAGVGLLLGNLFFPGNAAPFLLVGMLPWFRVKQMKNRRMQLFEQQLPESLDLLVRALRAGHSLSTALKLVGTELPDPIGIEFSHVAQEISLGMNVRDALDNLSFRVECEDLPFFVTAITIQQETGSNLAEILENLAHVIRERFKVYGKVRALTSMGRASANILAVWPCVMIGAIYLANPSYVEPLWTEEAGSTIIMMSVAMIVVGYIVCRKMAQIKV